MFLLLCSGATWGTVVVKIIPCGMLRDPLFSSAFLSCVSTLSDRICSGIPRWIMASASTSITFRLFNLRRGFFIRLEAARRGSNGNDGERILLRSCIFPLGRFLRRRCGFGRTGFHLRLCTCFFRCDLQHAKIGSPAGRNRWPPEYRTEGLKTANQGYPPIRIESLGPGASQRYSTTCSRFEQGPWR